MQEEIMVSVVVLTYNQEQYVEEMLESIVSQKHDFPYELLVGDDCSTDHTRDIILKYQEKYPSIVVPVFNEKNLGVVQNYYKIISMCRGKYIMECGGDDYWLPDKLQNQVDYMEAHPETDLLCACSLSYDQQRKRIEKRIWGSEHVSYEDLMRQVPISAQTMCFKRSLMEEYREQVHPERRDWKMEDIPFLLWLSLKYRIDFVDEKVAVYRVLSDSMSHRADIKKRLQFERNWFEVLMYFSNRKNRKEVRDNYRRKVAILYYYYGYYREYQRCLRKCDPHTIPLSYKIIYLTTFFPGIRAGVRKVCRMIKGTL